MQERSVVVVGGGLSGMAAAYTLARAGSNQITIVERGGELGGLAGTFEQYGNFYPLSYHHILGRDRTLLWFLETVDALPRVRWRKIRVLFHLDGTLYNLARPLDFMRFPMSVPDKFRFARLMTRSFAKSDWSDWLERSAAELVDAWGSPGVRRALFEPLARLKFDLPCHEISGAWLGARLYFREGSKPLGYIPGCNWTKVLCDGLARLLEEHGVEIRLRTAVARLHSVENRITEVELEDGERLFADLVVSSIPTEIYRSMVPRDASPHLDAIRYTAVVSAICATKQEIRPDFYWMNLMSLDCNACGLFMLNSLNPTIGAEGESCMNFVTHVPGRDVEFLRRNDEQLLEGYLDDFRRIFGFRLEPFWTQVARIPMYSPIFVRGYHNPPVRSTTWRNVYFAGNYRTFPSIASTGTALWSGIEAARAVLQELGQDTDVAAGVQGFRLKGIPGY